MIAADAVLLNGVIRAGCARFTETMMLRDRNADAQDNEQSAAG